MHDLQRIAGVESHLRPERADELQLLLADVDADDAVAEGRGQLDRVVAEPSGRADDGDAAPGLDVVVEQLLHRAVGGEPTAGQWGLVVTDAVGQHDQ